MTPHEQHLAANTPEAQAVRKARQHARAERVRRGRDCDVLAERARLIAFWKKCAETNKGYVPHNGKWWWVFTWNVCFRCVVLSGARAVLDARDKEHRARYHAELRETTRGWEVKKAEAAAAKVRAKSSQLELLP